MTARNSKKKAAKASTKPLTNSERGRAWVETKLVKATGELLAKQGPRSVTIRDIAKRAGVNHGQIHHYFGGKRGLIEATMRHLAREFAQKADSSASLDINRRAPLSLDQDDTYVMAVLRLVLDDELELALLDLDEGLSKARAGVEQLTQAMGLKKPTAEVKAVIAAIMTIDMAWAFMAPFILRQIGARASEEKEIRDRLAYISRQIIEHTVSNSKQ